MASPTALDLVLDGSMAAITTQYVDMGSALDDMEAAVAMVNSVALEVAATAVAAAPEPSHPDDDTDDFKDDCARVTSYADAHPDLICTHVDLMMTLAHMPRADVYPFRNANIVTNHWLFHHCSNCAIFTVSSRVYKGLTPFTPTVLRALQTRLEATTQLNVYVTYTSSSEGMVANMILHNAVNKHTASIVRFTPYAGDAFLHSVVVRGRRKLAYEERFETLYALLPLGLLPSKSALVYVSGGAYGLDVLARVQPCVPAELKLFKDPFAKTGKPRGQIVPYHPSLQHRWYGRTATQLQHVLLAEETMSELSNTLCIDMGTFVLAVFKALCKARPILCVTFQTSNMCFTSSQGLAGLFWLGKNPPAAMRVALRSAIRAAVEQLRSCDTSDTARAMTVAVDVLARDDVAPGVYTLLIKYVDRTKYTVRACDAVPDCLFNDKLLGVEFLLSRREHKPSQGVIAAMFQAIAQANGLLYGSMSFDGVQPFRKSNPRVEFCNDMDASSAKINAAAVFSKMATAKRKM